MRLTIFQVHMQLLLFVQIANSLVVEWMWSDTSNNTWVHSYGDLKHCCSARGDVDVHIRLPRHIVSVFHSFCRSHTCGHGRYRTDSQKEWVVVCNEDDACNTPPGMLVHSILRSQTSRLFGQQSPQSQKVLSPTIRLQVESARGECGRTTTSDGREQR